MYKDFPILQLHPQAAFAAEAAECAGEQGKYWEMHRALFANATEWDSTRPAAQKAVERYAGEIGLNRETFGTCLADRRYRAHVEANMAEGRHLGVAGTPAFVVNGKLLSGAQAMDVFKRVLDRELKTLDSSQ